MTKRTQKTSNDKTQGISMFEFQSYQCVESLSEAQMIEIDRIANKNGNDEQNLPVLDSLLFPVREAFNDFSISVKVSKNVTHILINAMNDTKKPFWAFTKEVWCSLLKNPPDVSVCSTRAFAKSRHTLALIAYLLCDYREIVSIKEINKTIIAQKIFKSQLDDAVNQIISCLVENGYSYPCMSSKNELKKAVSILFLTSRTSSIKDIDVKSLETARDLSPTKIKRRIVHISYAMNKNRLLEKPIEYNYRKGNRSDIWFGTVEEWNEIIDRWHSLSSDAKKKNIFGHVLMFSRWLKTKTGGLNKIEDITTEIALDFVKDLSVINIGDISTPNIHVINRGKKYSPIAQNSILSSLRVFFSDIVGRGWVKMQFIPRRIFATPRSIRNHIRPNPRVIEDDVWSLLVNSALNLNESDLPVLKSGLPVYPLEFVTALATLWVFGGLRQDEIRRLPVDAIRWVDSDGKQLNLESELAVPAQSYCQIRIPPNKTSGEFFKPVDRAVGEAIAHWLQVRPHQPGVQDRLTGKTTELIFMYRTHLLGRDYLNETLIPLLCRKAEVPQDVAKKITSHRARSTLASQLANADPPMTIEQIRQWLGHTSLQSTIHYVRIKPTRLGIAYHRANSDIRSITTVLDVDAVQSGAAARGQPYLYYDLGHGYCQNSAYARCPHRMACAHCEDYRVKDQILPLIHQGTRNLLQMREIIPLSELEREAVDDGLAAFERLVNSLQNEPTPDGRTPQEIAATQLRSIDI